MVCPSCEREIHREDMLTKNGCVWCDSELHIKKEEK